MTTESEIAPTRTQAVPDIEVQVRDENSVMHDGDPYEAGDTFVCAGPTAIALVQGGHVDILRSVEAKAKPKRAAARPRAKKSGGKKP